MSRRSSPTLRMDSAVLTLLGLAHPLTQAKGAAVHRFAAATQRARAGGDKTQPRPADPARTPTRAACVACTRGSP